MKKFLYLSLIVVFGSAVLFSGCKKYADGPVFSLATKKGRVVNTWKMEKMIENGTDVTATLATFMANFSIEFKSDNTYLETGGGSSAETGTWDFDSKKAYIVTTPNGSSSANRAEILRLKSNEMWLKTTDGNDTSEIHYVSK